MYTPLHLHTNISPDGLGTIDRLIRVASERGFKSLAITDHGTCGGHVSFWSAAKKNGIKTIFGNEMYLMHNGKRGHLTVLARDNEGYKNLLSLNNLSYTKKDKGYPTVNLEDISRYSSGLIILSGCSASPLYHGSEAEAISFAGSIYDIVGRENFYAEVMGVIEEDNFTRPSLISKKLGIEMIITNDTHFAEKKDSKAHTIMCMSRKGFDYTSEQLYLKTEEELLNTTYLRRYAGLELLEKLINNSGILAGNIIDIDLSATPLLPSTSGIDIISIARNKCNPLNTQRLEYEISVINSLGLVDYFSILYDIVNYCNKSGIKIGPGRGSGAGSYFLYLLGITRVDPIEYGLIFERFINPTRKDMADFDLDIEASRRDEVIKYANDKWEAWPISNYSRYSHSSLIRDIGRFFNVPLSVVSEVSASESPELLNKFFDLCEIKHSTSGVSKTFSPDDARHAYNVMEGQVRHRGKHAGGVVIATRDVPLENGQVAWTEGVSSRELTTVGLVKYDILGVTALTQLALMEEYSGKVPETLTDKAVYDSIFCSGRTEGIFQFGGSTGIVQLTKQVAPKSILDLSVINALYRPGPLDSGMAWKYPEYKKNPRKIHPDIDSILSETSGVIVYQEQVMSIVAMLSGGSLADADDARKLISKGKPGDIVWEQKMREFEDVFKAKGYKNYEKSIVDLVWNEIITFGRYGFNKSHSTAYSIISYNMAWYKHYYPCYFYTALLNGDSENAEEWIYSAVKDSIRIKHPDINKSGLHWTTDGNIIYAPLTSLKFFGEKQAGEFIKYRNNHGPFNTIEELSRVPKVIINSRVRKQLYLGYALHNISGDISSYIPDFSCASQLPKVDREVEALGYRLPGEDFIDFFNTEASSGKLVGFVSEVEKRNKGKGDYFVVKLTPKSSFWTKKNVTKLKKWDLISATVNKGEATEIWRKRE